MLSRPDVGTKEHIVTWLGNKPEGDSYEWLSGQCPAAHYSREFGDEHTPLNLEYINNLAKQEPHTWGALAERVCR
jgi:hypothetical protein